MMLYMNGPGSSTKQQETYRVCLSADVTARCRELGLLTSKQFVCFFADYKVDSSWGPTMLYPSVCEEGQPDLGRRTTTLPGMI